MTEQNKRKFPRASYPCSINFSQTHNFDTINAYTVNIGAGGILASSSQELKIGTKVEIDIEFSTSRSFQCMGIILRCHPNRNTNNSYDLAVIFEGLDETKVSFLKDLVDKLLTLESSR